MNSFNELQNILDYKFKDEDLLLEALTHQSYANENNISSYERLEFLGDAVIELVVSEYIFHKVKCDAGCSTKIRASLVSTSYLYEIAKSLYLDNLVRKSKSLQQLSKKNIADLFESVIGAIFIDGGLEVAKKLILKYVIIDDVNINYVIKNNKDHKSLLQEKLQAENKTFEYLLVSTNGPDHSKEFLVNLTIDGVCVSTARAGSIRSAEDLCAEQYLNSIKVKQ